WTLDHGFNQIVPRLSPSLDEVIDAFMDWNGEPEPDSPIGDGFLTIHSWNQSIVSTASNVLISSRPLGDRMIQEPASWAVEARAAAKAEALELAAGIRPWDPGPPALPGADAICAGP